MSEDNLIVNLPAVPEADGQLPLEHLQLSTRTLNTCRLGGCRTIADVAAGLATGKFTVGSVGRKTHGELRAALVEVCTLTDTEGRIDWDKVWTQRGVATPCLALTSRTLDRAAPQFRALRLGALHLRKACAGLESAGFRTVGGLIDAARNGIGELANFGKVAQGEVIEALQALSKSTNGEGKVDWECYAIARGFSLLPEDAATSGSAAELLKSLPGFCEKVVTAQFNDRAWEVFKRRLLVPEKNRETLEAIGIVYGVTRERVRQIEESCLEALRKPILEDDYCGLEFRLRAATVSLFREARGHFKSLGLPAWTESRWLEELSALWQVGENELRRYDRLLVETLGYRWVTLPTTSLEPLIVDEMTLKSEADQLTKTVVAVHEILRANCQGLDSFEMVRGLKKQGIEQYGLEDVPVLADLCSTAEVAGGDSCFYRTQFLFLKSRADQAVRVLQEAGKPLHHSDLLRELNRRLPESRRFQNKENLVGQMGPDNRLHPIGKSGEWALTEWGVESRSLIDIIEDVLASVGEALPVDAIVSQVLEKRPGSASSIAMLLAFNQDRFRRVSRGIYGLAAWGDEALEGAISDESVGRFIEDYVASHGGGAVDFKDLRKAFEVATKLGARSAAGVLATHPAVEVSLENSYRRTAVYRRNWHAKPVKHPYRRSAPLQADQIVEEATKMLLDSPLGELPLVDVVKSLAEQMGIGRPNLYSAIGQAPEIEKVLINGSAFKLLRLRNGKQPSFPQLDKLQTAAWRKECIRAVAKLTVDEVDIGLFLLGRLFDQGMTLLVQAARNAGHPVSDGNLGKLNHRIDWAFSQGVLKDKATLTLLRVERNERGHEPPTLAERVALEKAAPFLAGLYIDYLILIEQQIASIQSEGKSTKS